MAEIILCAHCGEKCSKKYCVHCNTVEKRKDMDEENVKIGEILKKKYG